MRAIPPKSNSRIPIMNAISDFSLPTHDNVFGRSLSLEALRERAPAVFTSAAHEGVSSRYTFIPSSHVLEGLITAGFLPVDARQTRTRSMSPSHARHVVRFRRRYESVSLRDQSIPELILVNDHSGMASYQLRMGIYRAICSNGMIVSRGAFPTYCVSHRGNVVDEVVARALQVSEHFEQLAAQVERMEQHCMLKDDQLAFAARALALRFDDPAQCGVQPSQLLTCRRVEDTGDNLWVVLNRTQEHLCRGGLSRRSPNGRLTSLRSIRSIARDLRLNSQLWDLATEVLAA
jgi:hypothetical protein